MATGALAGAPLGLAASGSRFRRRAPRSSVPSAAASSSDGDGSLAVENCSGCLGAESCPCPKAVRRAKQRRRRRDGDGEACDVPGRRATLASLAAVAGAASWVGAPAPAFAMSNGLVSDAWSTISGAPSDLTFPEDFLGTWLCYSTLTRVDTPQGEELVQDLAVVNRARRDVGSQIVYPMRFVRNDQGRVVMDRAYNVVKMAEATAKQYNVIEAVEWDVNDPNVLRGSIGGDGRSVFFRVNQRSEEYPAPDRIETSEVAQIVFDGGDNGGYASPPAPTEDGLPDAISAGAATGAGAARQPKIKSSRTFTKWKFRSVEEAKDGPAIVAGQTVYDYLTSFDPGFIESRGQPVTQYTYKLALFKANKYNLEN